MTAVPCKALSVWAWLNRPAESMLPICSPWDKPKAGRSPVWAQPLLLLLQVVDMFRKQHRRPLHQSHRPQPLRLPTGPAPADSPRMQEPSAQTADSQSQSLQHPWVAPGAVGPQILHLVSQNSVQNAAHHWLLGKTWRNKASSARIAPELSSSVRVRHNWRARTVPR